MVAQNSQAAPTRPEGPKGWIFGAGMREFQRDPLGYMRMLARTYGDFVPLRLVRGDGILLAHPDLIEEVLVTRKRDFVKGRGIQALKPMLGNGLLIAEGDFWRRQRRLAQPAFHRERVAGYGKLMVGYGEEMLARWRPGEVFNLHEEMMRVTLAIVARSLFNTDVTAEAPEFGRGLEILMDHFNWRSSMAFLVPVWLPVGPNRRFARAKARLDEIVYGIIQARRRSGEDPGDLLSMLLAARDDDGSGMTDEQLRDEIMTLLLAGHETTANALTWTFKLLSEHPDVDRRLADELSATLGDRSPSPADLPKLPYADMVIKESMRLFPPSWVLGYQAINNTSIGGHPVAKGTTVFMSQWVVHHDGRWFADPDEFRPERWAEPAIRKLPAFAYFPFGGGERLCIGRPFALMEAVLLLATVARSFRIEVLQPEEIELEPTVTLRPRHGVQAKAVLR